MRMEEPPLLANLVPDELASAHEPVHRRAAHAETGPWPHPSSAVARHSSIGIPVVISSHRTLVISLLGIRMPSFHFFGRDALAPATTHRACENQSFRNHPFVVWLVCVASKSGQMVAASSSVAWLCPTRGISC